MLDIIIPVFLGNSFSEQGGPAQYFASFCFLMACAIGGAIRGMRSRFLVAVIGFVAPKVFPQRCCFVSKMLTYSGDDHPEKIFYGIDKYGWVVMGVQTGADALDYCVPCRPVVL